MKKLISLVWGILLMTNAFAQQKVEYTDFIIAEKPKAKYEGIYKNEKPFSGYFKAEDYIDDTPFIDYYENGNQKFRYYFDYLEKKTYSEKIYYDKKTEYENGKIKNGFDIKKSGNAFICSKYKDFKRTKIGLDIGAVHYFNSISFELKGNSLVITELISPEYRLEIKKGKHKSYQKAVYHKDNLFYQPENKTPQEVSFASPNSITYYIKNNKTNQLEIKTYKIEEPNEEEEEKTQELFENAQILGNLFVYFSANDEDSIEDILERIESNAKELNLNRTSSFRELFIEKNSEKEIISILVYDEKGKIEYGGKITPNKNGTYKLEVYGKEKKEYPELSLDEIKKIIDEVIVVE